MKMVRFFAAFAVFMTAYTFVSASETSDNFAKWVPNFAASDLNQRKDAQQNWQTFCREKGNNPDVRKEIIRVSAEQLTKNNPTDTTVWIVRQLGIAGDAAAVPTLAKCLASDEVRIRDEAARALANISGTEAEEALKTVNSTEAKNALTARTIKANVPKNNEVETQFPQAIPYIPFARNAEVNSWMEGYSKLNDMEKAQVLSNLTARTQNMQIRFAQRRTRSNANADNRQGGQRGNRQGGMRTNPYLPLALEAVQSSDETLRNAGILAVGALGGRAEVPFLLEQARVGANKDLAKVALSRMNRQGIDALLIENLKSEQDNERFLILADVLSRRFNAEIRPVILEKAKAADTSNRLQLLQLAEPLATKTDLGDFVKTWALITDRRQKDQAEQIIARLSEGKADVVVQALDNWDTPESLSLLGRIGDAEMIDKIKQSKNAVQAFRTWPNARVADNLFAIAGDDKYSDDDRLAALRAFIRVISLPNDQIKIRINDAEKVKRLADAYTLAKRSEEKRYIIERVGQIRTIESLRFVLKYFDETELQERVCESILNLAHHVDFKRSAIDEFNAALDKVLAVTKRNDFRDRANRYKTQQ